MRKARRRRRSVEDQIRDNLFQKGIYYRRGKTEGWKERVYVKNPRQRVRDVTGVSRLRSTSRRLWGKGKTEIHVHPSTGAYPSPGDMGYFLYRYLYMGNRHFAIADVSKHGFVRAYFFVSIPRYWKRTYKARKAEFDEGVFSKLRKAERRKEPVSNRALRRYLEMLGWQFRHVTSGKMPGKAFFEREEKRAETG